MVGEDGLSCILGEHLVAEALPQWSLAGESIATGGVTKLVGALPRYARLARGLHPVLCVADTDGQCPVTLLKKWMPAGATASFHIRLAVTEAESWLLADRVAVAEFFQVPLAKVPSQPDLVPDPKEALLRLAKLSKVKALRQEVVTASALKPGVGYQVHLRTFVRDHWRADRAKDQSASLARAITRLRSWRTAVKAST